MARNSWPDDPILLIDEVAPTRYDLELRIDLDGERFSGEITMKGMVAAKGQLAEVRMHCAELDVRSCELGGLEVEWCLRADDEIRRCKQLDPGLKAPGFKVATE